MGRDGERIMSIIFRQVNYVYLPKTPYESHALKDIDLTIESGTFTAIIGHTGSGKSTLIQHINALLLPTSGEVEIENFVIRPHAKTKGIKRLRKVAGLVFQFPEYQLFEETVFKDIAFGPKNFGAKEADLKSKVSEVLKLVGLDDSYLERSPFELSGGQKRRVAIAGILAMDPDILVLDEPTAGLDPQGAIDMMALFQRIHAMGKTVILVTHEMEYVLRFCQQAIVMQAGKIVYQGTPSVLFSDEALLKQVEIQAPQIIRLANELQQKGMPLKIDTIKSVEDFVKEIVACRNVGDSQ